MIRFKLKYSIQDISISEGDIRFSFKASHDLSVRITSPDEAYLTASASKDVVFCEAELSLAPQEGNYKLLDDIIESTHTIQRDYKSSWKENHYTTAIRMPFSYE